VGNHKGRKSQRKRKIRKEMSKEGRHLIVVDSVKGINPDRERTSPHQKGDKTIKVLDGGREKRREGKMEQGVGDRVLGGGSRTESGRCVVRQQKSWEGGESPVIREEAQREKKEVSEKLAKERRSWKGT